MTTKQKKVPASTAAKQMIVCRIGLKQVFRARQDRRPQDERRVRQDYQREEN